MNVDAKSTGDTDTQSSVVREGENICGAVFVSEPISLVDLCLFQNLSPFDSPKKAIICIHLLANYDVLYTIEETRSSYRCGVQYINMPCWLQE
jgi:hypothetical protein